MLLYDPGQTVHKMPAGAVTPSDVIHFNVLLPQDYEEFYPIYFMVQKDEELWCEHRCIEVERMPEGPKRIGTMWTATAEGLYFYKFCTKKADGTVVDETPTYQQTVYNKCFTTPSWLRGAVIYQIFPDRFRRSGKTPLPVQCKNWVFREAWGDDPAAGPDENGVVLNNDFFGGDLPGIEESLPYLAGLGVNVIYLNPIFQAYSNHRYDTADYEKIDPLLGTEEDFRRLCISARALGIRIILDGVFNHTGSHSRYFNKDGAFDSLGAYQSKESPYFDWYSFTSWPAEYACWWGIDTLPNLREENPEVLDYMIRHEDSVVARWLRAGASGFRLDVADELPDGFLDALRVRVKELDPEACIIGEVWEDASNKVAYGARRRYLAGGQLDTVMNYPLKDGILNFLCGIETGLQLSGRMKALREHYPEPAFMTLMNILGTHDTPRLRTALSGNGTDAECRERLYCALMIWAFMPGAACIYYGDEIGMEGGKDPMNRKCFQPELADAEITAYYKKLLAFRREIRSLGEMELIGVRGGDDWVEFTRDGAAESVKVLVHKGSAVLDEPCPIQPERILSSGPVAVGGQRIRMEGLSCAALYFRKV